MAEDELVQITNDEDVNQAQPQLLDEGLAWVAHHEDGNVEVVVHSFGEAIEPSSSLLLQASIMTILPLVFVWAHQSASRKED
jgi:hypothetical protein